MNSEEIRDLLPFYLTKKLSPDELSAVENALKDSLELRNELESLKLVQKAIIYDNERKSSTHPSTEDLLLYAEKGDLDPKKRIAIESHIQLCDECNDDLNLVLKTFPLEESGPIPHSSFLEKARDISLAIWESVSLPVFAVPAVAVAALCIYLLIPQQPGDFTTSFTLTYQDSYRGHEGQPAAVPRLNFTTDTTRARLMLLLPGAPNPRACTITLDSPTQQPRPLPGSVLSGHYNSSHDSVSVLLTDSMFDLDGRFVLSVVPMNESPYHFELDVTRKK